jgi:hypothetical protein
MRSYPKSARSAPAVSQPTPQLVTQAGGRYRLVRSLFARQATEDSVATKVHFHASPEAVWNLLMSFEEVPGRPPFILRLLLPHPVRSEGDKSDVGAAVRCTYKRSNGDSAAEICDTVLREAYDFGNHPWARVHDFLHAPKQRSHEDLTAVALVRG